jgi:hypothetical protein
LVDFFDLCFVAALLPASFDVDFDAAIDATLDLVTFEVDFDTGFFAVVILDDKIDGGFAPG